LPKQAGIENCVFVGILAALLGGLIMRLVIIFLALLACGLVAVIAVKDAEVGELSRLNEAITGELAEISTELRSSQKELHSKTRQLQTAREQLEIANRTIDRLDARLAEAPAAEAQVPQADAKPEDPKAEASRSFMKAVGKFLDNPELRGMREAQQREAFKRTYTTLFELLELDAARDEQLRALLLERQLAMADFGPRFMSLAGDADKLKALTEEMGEIRAKYDGQLKDLLGDDYPRLQEYETTVHDRESLAQLNNRLSAVGEPLDDASNDAMLQVMSEARRNAELDADWQDPRVLGELMEPGAVDALLEQVDVMQRAVYTGSEAILSESQRKILGRQQKMQAGMLKATMGAFAK
jgi:hypothetical protein